MSTPAPRTRLQFLRPFTTRVFNRFSRLFAGHLPGFAIVEHTGRRSGTHYRTPMNVFTLWPMAFMVWCDLWQCSAQSPGSSAVNS